MTVTFYHHGSSVCAAKVRFAMAERELGWDGVYIDILKGEQFDLEYLKLNPKGVVPTLVHDGVVNRNSTVICEYLDTDATVAAIMADGGAAFGTSADVTSDDALSTLVTATEREFGSLDILVNNASIFAALEPNPFMQIDNDEFDKVTTVNARGVHQATKTVVPAGGGKIIKIASGTVLRPSEPVPLPASKGAVVALTRCFGGELGDMIFRSMQLRRG